MRLDDCAFGGIERTESGIDLSGRPTLDAWLKEYDAIEQDYCDSLSEYGVRFPRYGSHFHEVDRLRNLLKKEGALFLNGGSSISWGFLSDACKVCVGGIGSKTFFLNLKCPHNCYYCLIQTRKIILTTVVTMLHGVRSLRILGKDVKG